MEEINNFPRVGNASIFDFNSSVIHIIFHNTPGKWMRWVNVWGYFGLTFADLVVLILCNAESLLFLAFGLACFTIWLKQARVLEMAQLSIKWMKWMISAARLISWTSIWTSIRAFFSDVLNSIPSNSQPRQRPIDESPAKAPSSTQIEETRPAQRPTSESSAKAASSSQLPKTRSGWSPPSTPSPLITKTRPARRLIDDTPIKEPPTTQTETITSRKFFEEIIADNILTQIAKLTKFPNKPSNTVQDERHNFSPVAWIVDFSKRLTSRVATILAVLWKLLVILFHSNVSILRQVGDVIIKLISTISTGVLAAFQDFISGLLYHWVISGLCVCFLGFTAFAIDSYIKSNPNAAQSSDVASFLEAFKGDITGNLWTPFRYLLGSGLWSLGFVWGYLWALLWSLMSSGLWSVGFVWGYAFQVPAKFIWGLPASFWKNYILYYSCGFPSVWKWTLSWLPNRWNFLGIAWQYASSLIIDFGLPISLLVLSVGCFLYSKRLLVYSAALFLPVPVWGYFEHEACTNSMGFTVFALLIIAFVTWAVQTAVDFTRIICPHIWGLPFSFITWQPIIWIAILLLGQHMNLFSISMYARLYTSSPWICVFLILAVFKGVKIFIHTVSYYLWTRPAQPPHNPTIIPADVTVIIPTVGEFGEEFIDTVESVLKNEPGRIIISTTNAKMLKAQDVCLDIQGGECIEVMSVEQADKRVQLLKAVQAVRSIVTVYADDHVTWPTTFLRSALAPFEDPIVGLVATSKRVVRNHNLPFWDSFFNYIACIYLERHNFECTATNNIDGGVFVVSGRTALARTSVLHSLEYRSEFQTEFFGLNIGPMKVDDDNFNTRFMIRHGWKTIFINDPHATISTTLVSTTGQLPKFRSQLLRWARTTWRSNIKSLLTNRACYQTTPWTTYAMFFSSFVNFALFYDAAMFFALKWSGSAHMCSFLMLLLLSKLIKPLPHLLRESRDWQWVPMGILFGYFHSFIKLYAMLTMGNIDWSGRQGIKSKGG